MLPSMVEAPPAHRCRVATKLLLVGCLFLGAGFLIKMDTTGFAGNIASRGSRAAESVMQYGGRMWGSWREPIPRGSWNMGDEYGDLNRYGGYNAMYNNWNNRPYGPNGQYGGNSQYQDRYGAMGYGQNGLTYGAEARRYDRMARYGYGPSEYGMGQYGYQSGPGAYGMQYGMQPNQYGMQPNQYGMQPNMQASTYYSNYGPYGRYGRYGRQSYDPDDTQYDD